MCFCTIWSIFSTEAFKKLIFKMFGLLGNVFILENSRLLKKCITKIWANGGELEYISIAYFTKLHSFDKIQFFNF